MFVISNLCECLSSSTYEKETVIKFSGFIILVFRKECETHSEGSFQRQCYSEMGNLSHPLLEVGLTEASSSSPGKSSPLQKGDVAEMIDETVMANSLFMPPLLS